MSYLHDHKKHKILSKKAVEASKSGNETERQELISKIHKKNKNYKKPAGFVTGYKEGLKASMVEPEEEDASTKYAGVPEKTTPASTEMGNVPF